MDISKKAVGPYSDGVPSVGWIGSRSGCFDWLSSRVAEHFPLELHNEGELSPRAERLIIAVQDRLATTNTQMNRIIPFAVATGSWWDGSVRTGLAREFSPLIPWYRWWDGWFPWLLGHSTELLDPFPSRLVAATSGIRTSSPDSSSDPGRACSPTKPDGKLILRQSTDAGNATKQTATAAIEKTSFESAAFTQTRASGCDWLIVSDCPHIGQSWQHVVRCHNATSDTIRRRDFQAWIEATNSKAVTRPSYVLFDDSCFTRTCYESDLDACAEFFRFSKTHLSDAIHIAALTNPHWQLWKIALESGADELVAKPGTGGALTNLISHYRNAPCRGRMLPAAPDR